MNVKKFIGLGAALLVILWLSPFLSAGRAQQPFPHNPGQFAAGDRTLYLPFIFSIKREPTPTQQIKPSNTTTPVATTRPGVPTNTPVPTVSSSGSGAIADHTVIDRFSSIPDSAVQQARSTRTLFMHQSTGESIRDQGLKCLQGTRWQDPNNPDPEAAECATYADNYYDFETNWYWPHWENWPGYSAMANAIEKTDAWYAIANQAQADYQVLGMKFCYVDAWNLDFEYYRQKMEALEQAYPDKIFIWSTTALYNTSVEESPGGIFNKESMTNFNDQVRAYALAKGKYLYDIADIESHDPNGNACISSSGYPGLCNEYYDGIGGGGGGHPDVAGSIRLAKGFWWLMGRISGWDGN